ncbi:MAG TPA: type II toxin-antitoxin system prevent-host-death family antitoxin [Planctomycetota bacterium]|nr:type II toxin-antitoxin system prevent-host-death family antitoxin [Planctomycetota bacterium]
MLRVSVTDLKNKLSRYLRLVKRGETIEVCEREVPIARLEGVGARAAEGDDPLRQLVKDGVVTLATAGPQRKLLQLAPLPCAIDPVKVLVEERGDR